MALTRVFVAIIVIGRARLTITRLATENAVSSQTVESTLAFIARHGVDKQLAMTLTATLVTNIELVERAIAITFARRTATLSITAHVIVAIFALFALSAMHKVLAGTHDFGHSQVLVAARKVGLGAVRMTRTRLAHGVVVQVRATFGALLAREVTLAVAFARERITRLAYSARFVALTLDTLGVFVETGRAHVASGSTAAFFAVTLRLTAEIRAAWVYGAVYVTFARLKTRFNQI